VKPLKQRCNDIILTLVIHPCFHTQTQTHSISNSTETSLCMFVYIIYSFLCQITLAHHI